MGCTLRKRLLSSAIVTFMLGIAALVSPQGVERLYAAHAVPCYCSANCALSDCECGGNVSCSCACVLFRAMCECRATPP